MGWLHLILSECPPEILDVCLKNEILEFIRNESSCNGPEKALFSVK
jgi:hypothetical protein